MVYRTIIFCSLLLAIQACGNSPDKPKQEQQPGNSSAQNNNAPKDGKALYTKNCALCHGNDGKKGTSGAKDLTVSSMTDEEKKNIITNGKGSMAAFGKLLNDEEISLLVGYINTLK